MVRFEIDGTTYAAETGTPVLKAALDNGIEIPHYCYHPALTVVASCRLCLVEIDDHNPRSGQVERVPKLVPSCQTPVKEGLRVWTQTDKVRDNQRAVMEYFLINHPLDCPVCDQAGECWLQDYSYRFGNALSRMIEPKQKQPKKDIGKGILLYADRCVMCSRCVRFTREVSGTNELCVVQRGNRSEIDVFPGMSLDNKLSGNTADICPVGALLDKKFLFTQRVWHLQSAESVCPGCSAGCNITVDHNNGIVYRLRPRYNPHVNDHWMCDEGRWGWEYHHSEHRIGTYVHRQADVEHTLTGSDLPAALRTLFEQAGREHPDKVAVVLSPMLSCEEALLLGETVRSLVPNAVLVAGPVPTVGQDESFKSGFTIRAEKAPNRLGVRMVLDALGGPQASFEDFVTKLAGGSYDTAMITGGYFSPWVTDELVAAADKAGTLIVHDLLDSALAQAATVRIGACTWAERSGTFVNHAGNAQPFEWGVPPLQGLVADQQWLWQFAGRDGMFNAEAMRDELQERLADFALCLAPEVPEIVH